MDLFAFSGHCEVFTVLFGNFKPSLFAFPNVVQS